MRLIPREEDFTSHLRSPAVAARIGTALGVAFGIAFVTGVISHWSQSPHPWFFVPTRPSWGYRVSQGLHVASGTAAIPLLLVKLWSVFPKLFAAPPRRLRLLLVEGLERGSIAVLVAAAIFQLATGLLNTTQWYPWSFHFRATHDAVGWIAIGALVVHVAVKLPIVRRAWASDVEATDQDRPSTATQAPPGGLTRRGLVRTAYGSAAVAVLASAGATVPALRQVSVFGVRSGDGPQGIPINKSARAARVTGLATAATYTLELVHGDRTASLTADQVLAMAEHTSSLPIACVEGWSANGHWRGVRLRDLMSLVDRPHDGHVRVTSLQPSGPYRSTFLPHTFVDDELTLLATHLDGERLSLDHGFPCRIIAPNRPGVLQTKWVSRLQVETA